MSNTTLYQALETLEAKIKKGKKHFNIDCGICENVSIIANKYFTFQIKELVKDWKHFSGDLVYPIGGIDDYNHHKMNETLWQGEQLKLRMDLIKFLKKNTVEQ